MCRIVLILISSALTMSIGCYAAKLSNTPSMLLMEGGIGMQIDVENVYENIPFNTFVSWIGNTSYSTGEIFQGSLALALISEDGEIKELIHEERNLSLSPGWGFGQWQRFCNLSVVTAISDTDIIRFITLENGDDTWSPVTSLTCESVCCNVRNNRFLKSNILVTCLGNNDIPCEGYCWGTYGNSRQPDPIYSSSYDLSIAWPVGKDHHFVKVKPNFDDIQIDPDKIIFQCISKPEYMVTLMACSDDELIMEQRHFTVDTPGSFGQQLKDSEDRLFLNNISVSGMINEADIAFMRDEMPMLEHIDLSEADIVGGYLPDGAFEEKGIKSIILPKRLSGLGTNSLRETKLFKLEIPESVDYYGLNALNYCEDLTLIVLHNPNVIPISWCVLAGTNRENGVLFVPNGTREEFSADSEWGRFGQIVEGDNTNDYVSESDGTYSYSGIYPNVTITKVTNPQNIMIVPETVELDGKTFNVTGIGARVFSSYQIYEIHIPANIISLGEYAIDSNCSRLTKIVVDENNPVFFSDGGVLYNRVTSTMLTYPQAKNDLEYTVPEGITSIEGWACYNHYLCKIIFPTTLKSIGSCAFCYSNLRYADEPIIISKAVTPPYLNQSAFSEISKKAKVYVPAKSLDAYKSDVNWSYFFNIYALTDGSGIDGVEADGNYITVVGNTVYINSDTVIEIYSIDGQLHYKGNEGSIKLPNGIYIFKLDSVVKKIKI